MEFKLGDRVKVKRDCWENNHNAIKNKEGIIIAKHSSTTVGVDFICSLGDDHCLHNIGGILRTDTGWNVDVEDLDLICEDPINKFFKKHPLEK
jgi:acetyltransferase-like isoleucine patch superfamily enzyme